MLRSDCLWSSSTFSVLQAFISAHLSCIETKATIAISRVEIRIQTSQHRGDGTTDGQTALCCTQAVASFEVAVS
eukprot:4484142-Amphidinium_carterae.1